MTTTTKPQDLPPDSLIRWQLGDQFVTIVNLAHANRVLQGLIGEKDKAISGLENELGEVRGSRDHWQELYFDARCELTGSDTSDENVRPPADVAQERS